MTGGVSALTDKDVADCDDAVPEPEEGVVVPEEGVVVPEEGVVVPEVAASTLAFEAAAAVTEDGVAENDASTTALPVPIADAVVPTA